MRAGSERVARSEPAHITQARRENKLSIDLLRHAVQKQVFRKKLSFSKRLGFSFNVIYIKRIMGSHEYFYISSGVNGCSVN